MEKRRLLCLHGYHGSAQVLRRQLAPLAAGLGDLVEFVCIDAPALAAGDFGWWHAVPAERSADQADAGIGPSAKSYEGWPKTLAAIETAFARHGPFDGILGFSQGAALAGLLVGLRFCAAAAADSHASQAGPLSFAFAMMVGGFASADPNLARLYDERSRYGLPSVHIIGRADLVVSNTISLDLASKFADPLILEHEGGHVIPNTPQLLRQLRTFLESQSGQRSDTSATRSTLLS